MAGLVFLLVFWVLAGACQKYGVGGFIVQFFFFYGVEGAHAVPLASARHACVEEIFCVALFR